MCAACSTRLSFIVPSDGLVTKPTTFIIRVSKFFVPTCLIKPETLVFEASVVYSLSLPVPVCEGLPRFSSLKEESYKSHSIEY